MNASVIQDKIRGSLIGGAAGDALGYAVEFLQENQIFSTYGKPGILSYRPERLTGRAVISDDTQMTLFTANALLFAMGRLKERGIAGDPRHYALYAYLGWLHTQENDYSPENRIPEDPRGWASWLLRDVPELYVCRAPGMTCLSALGIRKEALENGTRVKDFIASPVNNSKGCGGVMRVAPMGLIPCGSIEYRDMEGAQLAAITHSHPLGYMPAAVLTHIVHRLVYSVGEPDLKAIVLEARDTAAALFAENPYIGELTRILNAAVNLAENDEPDLDNIHVLGEGWVAEEALAISIYCSLRHQNDFSRAIIAAVNHKGDSDSTGAITGNIMGALVGYHSIEQKWKTDLELHDLILDIADRLNHDFS